jgi:chromosome segregation ATPase
MKPRAFNTLSTLKNLIAAMEEGDARYDARRTARQSRDVQAPEDPVQDLVVVSNDIVRSEDADASAELTEALRLAAEQRKAAEALLLDACVLEQRIAAEATAVRAAREYAEAKERAEAVATEEQRVRASLAELSQSNATAWKNRKDAEERVASSRATLDQTNAQIADLERRLLEAKQVCDQAQTALQMNDQELTETREQEAEAKRRAEEAENRVAECNAAREAADIEAKAAGERAEQLRNALSTATNGFANVADVQALAARIAEQAATLQQASHTGIAEEAQSEF